MRYKYPRTPHLPFSETLTQDDKILNNTNIFEGKEIIVTEKMDGENTTIYNDFYHARSIDSKHQNYHSWLLNYINTFSYNIPLNWRICGEYLYATHSIQYKNLKNYFLVFSIWNDDTCLSWDDTLKYCKKWNLDTVPVIYEGIYNENLIKQICQKVKNEGKEGVVIRLKDSFKFKEFDKSVAKYVRPNHVQTDKHWTKQEIKINKLKE